MKSMFTSSRLAAFAAVVLLGSVAPLRAAPATLTVAVDQPGHRVSPLLWGIFFEDINHSTDGGLYAELVRNRNFEDADTPDYWSPVSSGPAEIALSIDTSQPVSPKNRRSLKVAVANAGTGRAGVANGGFWGMAVQQGETYDLSLWARRADDAPGPLTISLESTDSVPYARAVIRQLTTGWKLYHFSLTSRQTDPKARLVISAEKPGTFWLDMVSLFPAKTWKGHGFRPDLAEMLVGLKPSFVRFPGGCWVEGDTMKESYRWKQTIGDPSERRTQHNIWGYEATHGIGYHEYLQLCEDLGAEPLFCINVGMSHKENVPMDQMGEYVQDALDAIEYANGPADSHWGALRAKAGHPAPFNLKYMEIGNENGGPAYAERYPLFVKAIREKYPEMHLIADVWGGIPKSAPVEIVDEHYYDTPDFFIRQAGKYDTYDRSGPEVFVGEYAVTRNAGLGNLRGAIGEAAFMTGLERNSDVVVLASYAPLFCNANHKRWPINLINYDSSRLFGLPSYYVQKLFSENRGDVVLPVDVAAAETVQVPSGGVGVGTWLTEAEFKDMQVTRDGQTLFAADLGNGTKDWRLYGGNWKVQDGALRQTQRGENIRALAGNPSWTNYTYTLKARKLGGQEGFLIPFLVQDDEAKAWWNIGGWGNSRHGLELDGISAPDVPGRIETGRWYDIRIEVDGTRVRCYLDGKLIHDAKFGATRTLNASATRQTATGEVILKVVNSAAEAQPVEIKLAGVGRVAPQATASVLTSAKPTDENTLADPTKVVPVTQTIPVTGVTLSHNFPANSLTVIRLKPE